MQWGLIERHMLSISKEYRQNAEDGKGENENEGAKMRGGRRKRKRKRNTVETRLAESLIGESMVFTHAHKHVQALVSTALDRER